MKPNRTRFHSFGALALFFVLLATTGLSAQAADPDYTPLHQGDLAPGFSEPLFNGQGTVSLASLKGKVVLLNFWAPWCAPCRDEMPLFTQLRKQWAGQFEVVGAVVFSTDAATREFLATYAIGYPIFRGSFDLMGQYNKVNALPTSYLIDKKGRVIEAFVGAKPEAVFRTAVEKAVKG